MRPVPVLRWIIDWHMLHCERGRCVPSFSAVETHDAVVLSRTPTAYLAFLSSFAVFAPINRHPPLSRAVHEGFCVKLAIYEPPLVHSEVEQVLVRDGLWLPHGAYFLARKTRGSKSNSDWAKLSLTTPFP